jgi:cell division protein FtsN
MRAMDAVIMKCLQKDPANRFQSVDQFEIALAKAAKARPARPWEVALNRGIERAEVEIRNRSRQVAEMAKTFLERQDWRSLLRIQEEPQAMLGVAGIVSALTVFLVFGAWKPRTINAQTVQIASQNQNSLPSPVAAVNGSVPSSRPFLSSTQDSLSPIASQQVDLYENLRAENAKSALPAADLPNANLGSAKATASRASSDSSRTVKSVKSPARTNERKAKLDAKSPAQSQALASPPQPENLVATDASKSATLELAAISSQPETAPQPAVELVSAASQPKTSGGETKTPQLYFEVGSFKDQTWANNAVDKLTQLGFHAVLIHKNLLWTQSYHVQVGPYTNQKDIAEARQSLSAQGYKAHPVN